MAHNTKSGVAHFAADDEDAVPRGHALPHVASCRRTTSRRAPRVMPTDDPLRMDEELDTVVPDSAQQALRHARRGPAGRRRRRVLRGPRALRAEHRLRLRAPGRLRGRRRRQPARASSPACSTSTPRARPARFVRTCDAFNIPILTFCDVPGLPARHQPGVGRDHPPRRQAALRLHRGDGPEDHGHHPQGLRRRLRRHGAPSTCSPTSTSPGRRPRSPSWAPRARSTSSTAATSPSRRRPRSAAPSSSTTTRRASPTPTRRPSAATSTT